MTGQWGLGGPGLAFESAVGTAPNLYLLVGESLNRILGSSFERWIACAQERSAKGDQSRGYHPIDTDRKGLRGKAGAHKPLQYPCQADAQSNADKGKKRRFPQNKINDIKPRSSQRLQDPDFAGSLQHRGIHRLKNTQKANANSNADHDVQRDIEPR